MKYEDFFVTLRTGPNAGQTPAAVFWGQVKRTDNAGCWLWEGPFFPNGYGRFNLRTLEYLAHRVAVLLYRGVLSENAECVRHTCDNRACVNPFHLVEGSQKENMQDMIDRGRQNPPKGEKCGKSRLKWSDVFDIRLRYANGEKQKDLAGEYGISPKQVSVIVNNRQWTFSADDFQNCCLETCLYQAFGDNPIYPLLGVANEAGELVGKLKKVMRGDYELTPEKIEAITDEIGDVLFYLAVLGFELGVPLSDAMMRVTAKLASRMDRGKIKGDGDNR